MASLTSLAWSSVGKKIIMACTGLGLIIFITMHLIGNSMLFLSNPDYFNLYGHKLVSLGPLLYVIEAGLVAFFLFRSISGITVWLDKRQARPSSYKVTHNAGSPSRKTFASVSMIYVGAILAIFVIIHVWQFKYGTYYKTTIDGEEIRDLYKLVVETFKTTHWMIFYVIATGIIGFHLWHGFWSAFQSLGLYIPRIATLINVIGYFLAISLAVGFVLIPIYIYFR